MEVLIVKIGRKMRLITEKDEVLLEQTNQSESAFLFLCLQMAEERGHTFQEEKRFRLDYPEVVGEWKKMMTPIFEIRGGGIRFQHPLEAVVRYVHLSGHVVHLRCYHFTSYSMYIVGDVNKKDSGHVFDSEEIAKTALLTYLETQRLRCWL